MSTEIKNIDQINVSEIIDEININLENFSKDDLLDKSDEDILELNDKYMIGERPKIDFKKTSESLATLKFIIQMILKEDSSFKD